LDSACRSKRIGQRLEGSLERVRSSREDEPFSLEGGDRREPEGPMSELLQHCRGTGEPNSQYGLRLKTLWSTETL